jgi:lycopene cyclase domain-containing protein
MNPHFTYLLVNLGSVAVPFLLSFDKRVAFYKKWKAFWPANLITVAFFVVWDVLFTQAGIWGFNSDYLTGVFLLNLPVEEWLFFICVPYACIFLYETFRTYLPGDPFAKLHNFALWKIIAASSVLLVLFYDHLYTALTAAFLLIGTLIVKRLKVTWVGWLSFAYLIIIIPFLIANGILTGLSFWEYPLLNFTPEGVNDMIVWYNNDHNMGIRVFSVPLDDFFYGLLLIAMNVSIYEWLVKRYQLR